MAFTRRQLRHTACATLLAWMFALLSGVANACVTQPNARAGLGSISSQASPVARVAAGPVKGQVHHIHHHGATATEQERHGSHSAEQGCLKFCADKSSSVTTSTAPQADPPGPLFVASAQWRSVLRVAAASRGWHFGRSASVGPPLFIRLLRLTI